MWHLLRADGVECGRNRVAGLCRIAGIETRRTGRFRNMRTYQKVEPAADDLVKLAFSRKTPNEIWVGDMTQIATRKGPIHLAVFINVCTHRVTGWSTGTRQTAKLAVEAMQAGIDSPRPRGGLIRHTDQGSQFASTLSGIFSRTTRFVQARVVEEMAKITPLRSVFFII